jgi:hypothetical protein
LSSSDPVIVPGQKDDSPLDNYQFDPSLDVSGYIPLDDRIEKPKTNIINEQSLLDPGFVFPSEAIIEQDVLKKTYQIKNPHHYGVTTLGGNISDPEYLNDFPLVGSNLDPSSTYCNSYSKEKGKTVGCLETHLHKAEFLPETINHKRSIDGRCLPGQIVVKPVAYHCSDPLCPICARHWAGLETARSVRRFSEFFNLNVNSFNQLYLSRGKGKYKRNPVVFCVSKEDYDLSFSVLYQLRHITVSMSKEDWKLPFPELKKKAETALMMAGVEGGCIIYHSKRWSRKYKIWRKGFHFHALGFLLNGRYDGKIVSGINAFSGIVIKVLPGDRSEIEEQVKTLMYQLSHAGVPSGHQHVVSWFGCCSYNQLSVPKKPKKEIENIKEKCPLCGSKMRPVACEQDDRHVLIPKNDGKLCVVSPGSWHYITRDGQKYDPITKTWSEQFRKNCLDPGGGGDYFDEY